MLQHSHSDHRSDKIYPAQVNPPLVPQLALVEALELAALKEATREIRRCVKSELQLGHLGALILGSEKRISFSNSFPH